MEPQLSTEKTLNKTQHHDCHGTTEFISSVRTILTNIRPPTSAGDKDLAGPFPCTPTAVQSTATLLWEYPGNQLSFEETLQLDVFALAVTNYRW